MANDRKTFLIFAKPAIGDILLATPLIHSIRCSEPSAVIDVMCHPGQEGILEGNPDVDNIVLIPEKPTLGELFSIVRKLFRKYDVAITNAADDRVHLYLLLFGKKRLSVTTVGGPHWKRWITYASVMDDAHTMHALVRNNSLGNCLGYRSDYQVVAPRPMDTSERSPLLDQILQSNQPYAVLHPEARLPYKRWTVGGWQDVMTFMHEHGMQCYLTGGTSAEEHAYLETLLRDAPGSVSNIAGCLRFAEVAEVLRGCTVYVGIDTVNSHLAAALGVPTIVLFGPENPVRWGPWPMRYAAEESPWQARGTQTGANVTIIQAVEPCDSCVAGDCKQRRNRGSSCALMTGIKSTQVIDELQRRLL